MDKSLVLFVSKYVVLFTFVFEVIFLLQYFLKKLNNVSVSDKKLLLWLFYLGSAVVLALMTFYGVVLTNYKFLYFLAVILVSFFVAWWLFKVWLKSWIARYIVFFDKKVDYGQIVNYEQNIYRFLGFNKDKILLEDLDGNVLPLPIDTTIIPVGDEICFFIKDSGKITDIQQIIRQNPYVETEKIAVITEEDLATREEKVKICIKDFADFKVLKQFKIFVDSSLK